MSTPPSLNRNSPCSSIRDNAALPEAELSFKAKFTTSSLRKAQKLPLKEFWEIRLAR
jgi:hypothetical protein